jgi:hypothetical protein
LGTGCAGGGFWKDKPTTLPPEVTEGAFFRSGNSAVVPAGGVSPFATVPSSLSWLAGKGTQTAKAAPTIIAPGWQNYIQYLPDPTRAGALGPGLAGQLFVYGPADLPATLDGSITVELFDITRGESDSTRVPSERWKFNRDVLKGLRSVDERFGPNYVLFLPWPSYRPDVTRVRITVRYDPENGPYPIYAPETRMVLSTSISEVKMISNVITSTPPRSLPPNLTTGGAGSASATGTAGTTPSPGMGVFRMGPPSSNAGPVNNGPATADGPIKP